MTKRRAPPGDDEHTLTQSVAVRRGPVEVSCIHVLDGPDRGLDALFADESVTVGSGPVATVRLRDPALSRLHCELLRTGTPAVRLRDLASKNGTWVGACRVRDCDLEPGVAVRVGGTTFAVEVQTRQLAAPTWRGGDQLGSLFGASPAMARLFTAIARVAATPSTVLVTGETGTGKELVARALHDASDRRAGPFVVVDGGALSKSLARSELFGHVRGAFTGATDDRVGAFERAHGGTLFLDEVGEIPPDVQPLLLRALERHEVQRIGEPGLRRVDVRVVAATHRDLRTQMNEGGFREDLLYRLLVVELRVPPLRDRGADVVELAHRFLDALAPGDREARAAVDDALASAVGHPWPGNVRELRNLVERAAAIGATGAIIDGGTATSARTDLGFAEAKREWNDAFERLYLARVLDEAGGNVSDAARRAGMNRGHLIELLARHGLRR